MSPSRERHAPLGQHARPRWLLLPVAVAAAVSVWLWQRPGTEAEQIPRADSTAQPSRAMPSMPVSVGATVSSPAGERQTAPARPAAAAPALSAAAQRVVQQIDQLTAMPPGEDAIALGRQLSASATPETAPAFREALLRTTHPAVERMAIAALARTADSAVMQALAQDYGALPAEQRGRVLQVLEGAANPTALAGLTRIVDTDTSEKRSPLTMSALYGIASLGTMDSIDYLLGQTATDNIDHALMAMERVRTRQGVELIRAAAAGSKGHEQLSPSMRSNLRRIASVAEANIAP
ncbi:MAG: hypothetical protein RL260_2040 [Pseudomonadota bacterium]|jgi:guanyl-specific ribonuclease Sa